MNTYARKVRLQLWLLRIFLVLAVVACVSYVVAAAVILLVVIGGAFIRITDLQIADDRLLVRRYYFYGLFFWSWRFDKTATLTPFTLVLQDEDVADADVGSAWVLLAIFGPLISIRLPRYSLQSAAGKVRLELYDGEQQRILQFLAK